MNCHNYYIVVQAMDIATGKLYAYMTVCGESCNLAKLFDDSVKTHIIGANLCHTKKSAIEQVNGLNKEWHEQGRYYDWDAI